MPASYFLVGSQLNLNVCGGILSISDALLDFLRLFKYLETIYQHILHVNERINVLQINSGKYLSCE